ncbi:MAG TPA: response regulator transcription factor [Bacteroidia bacterium]|nr:response regulator transcription factor [Bacteroidia bacterium]
MKVLLVEDEPKVALLIKRGLEEQNYEVTEAHDGEEGKIFALKNTYDIIILDVLLPQINGIELCKLIRKTNQQVPVLMLTALGTTNDKVIGLDAGADDYLTKPFKFQELLARVRALTRRQIVQTPNKILTLADLELNSENKTVVRKGQPINLTAREYFLLEFFMKNKGKVLSRAELAENVWEISFDTGTNVVDVYVNYLRNKIDKNFSPKLIHTVIGMGYVFKIEHEK